MRSMKILSTLPRVQISLIKAYTTHNDMLRGTIESMDGKCDVIVLAQASMIAIICFI